MKKINKKTSTTMHRQGRGWIVSYWDKRAGCYRLTEELPYAVAREAIGQDNCPGNHGGKCQRPDEHQHLAEG